MGPGLAVHEFLQELGGRHGPGRTPRHVAHVGEVALQAFGVFVVQGHAPAGVQRRLARGLQPGRQGLVVGEQAAAHPAEGHHAGAGQRGDVHHGRGLEAGRVGDGVAQHQAAFGVGVEHLDGLPAQAGDHVARLDGTAVGHVLAGGDEADHVDGGPQLGQRAEHAQHAGGAAHVELHLVHFAGGLDRDAAGVEGDALADERHGRLGAARTLVAQLDEAQGLLGALGHRHEGAHAELLHFRGAHDLDLDGPVLGERLRGAGQQGGRGVVAGAVGPFAGVSDAQRQRRSAREAGLGRRGIGHADHHARERPRLGLGFGGRIDVAGFRHGLHGRAGCRTAVGQGREAHGRAFDLGRLPVRRRTGQRLAHGARTAVAGTQQQHAPRRDGGRLIERQALAGLGLEVPLADRQRHQGGERVAAGLEAFGYQHGEQVAFLGSGGGQGQGLQIEVHNRRFPSSQCYSIHPFARNWPAASERRWWCWSPWS